MFNKLKSVFKNSEESAEKPLEEVVILLIETDLEFAKDVKLYLEKELKAVHIASDGFEAVEAFNKHKPNIVISEINIPNIDGVELSKIFKNRSQDIPIILISNSSDLKTIKEIIDIKIEKFIPKPITELSTLLEIVEKITIDMKNKSLKNKMECKEIIDPLTGIYNRNKINETIELEINKYKRFKTKFSMILVDIDNFSSINSKFGHKIGDKILKDVAIAIDKNTRAVDTVGRWDGDKFAIICLQTEAEGAVKLAKILREKLPQISVEKVGHIKASFGVVAHKDDDDIASLTKRLENALEKSKEGGEDRVSFW